VLRLVPYRIKHGEAPIALNKHLVEQVRQGESSNFDSRLLALIVIAVIVAIAFFHSSAMIR